MKIKCILGLMLTFIIPPAFAASASIWINDFQSNLAKVDSDTGQVTLVGNTSTFYTDIAFDPNNNLYGVTPWELYSIDKNTGKSTLIGSLQLQNGDAVIALVFDSDGTMYTFGAYSGNLYKVDPKTGVATILFHTDALNGGDLAFAGGNLYFIDGSNLWLFDLKAKSSTLIGNTGTYGSFGLINGVNGTMYALAGNSAYSLNLATGTSTRLSSWNSTLGSAAGATVLGEASTNVPTIPGTPQKAEGSSGRVSWREISIPAAELDPIKTAKASARASEKIPQL